MLDIKAVEEKLETVQDILDGLKEEIGFIKQKKIEQKEDLSKLCTIDEKIILKNVDSDFKTIYRDEESELLSIDIRPKDRCISKKHEGTFLCDDISDSKYFSGFHHLFNGIKGGECYKISDLIADLEEEIDL